MSKGKQTVITAVVMGAGQMGQAIAWSMDKLGYNIVLVDNDPKRLFSTEYNFNRVTLINADSAKEGGEHSYDFIHNADIVISAMPYHQNIKLASYCVSHGVRYCDLGGSVPVSAQINALGKRFNATVMTDLGLAPGWVNIISENMVYAKKDQGLNPVSMFMMVGGLPKEPNNYLKYNCTWSYDGLINEYKDDCKILVNGMQTLASGMDGLQLVDTSLGELEAFYTSGGSSHTIGAMQEVGVQNCSYKTLRYQGHRDAVRFLMRECRLDDHELKEVFMKACPPSEDVVIVRSEVDGESQEKIVESTSRFSAMQQATAFPLASAADIIARGVIQGVLSYKDIPYQEFNDNLDTLFKEASDD